MLKFIDLFAGIGGFRIALENLGFKCVFSAETNKHACLVYKTNFNTDPYCDITKLNAFDIPDFDILCAGFPCQSFSIAGFKKGFQDTRGTLFFEIERILREKKPQYFLLENVANLKNHDNGKTLHIILNNLQRIGYNIDFIIENAINFGLPQNRERIIIIGNLKHKIQINNIERNTMKSMSNFLDNNTDFDYLKIDKYTILKTTKQQLKSGLIFCGYLNKNPRKNGIRKNTEHLSRFHKQPNRIYDHAGTHPTISSQEKSGRYWINTPHGVRKTSINELFRLMGFPESFIKIGSQSELRERIGNSVAVPMIETISRQIFLQNEQKFL